MARNLFALADRGSISPSGRLIADIQKALNDQKVVSPITVDGLFGGQTVGALKTYQQAKSQPVTGIVTDDTWLGLMGTAAPPIFDRCLQVAASFEGTHFTQVVGNFDGAGVTWGIVGFTLIGGELGHVLDAIEANAPGTLATVFSHDAEDIKHIMHGSKPEQLAWADSVSRGPTKYAVADPWKTYFADLGALPVAQQAQVDRARDIYWAIAQRDAAALKLTDELDMLLLFDTAVQNGGMQAKGRLQAALAAIGAAGASTAADKRKIIADVVAKTAAAEWEKDVLDRKMAIATGAGTVHDGHYDLGNWGFMDGVRAS